MISSISFCITGSEGSGERPDRCIESVRRQEVPESEILIYGTEELTGAKSFYTEGWKKTDPLNKIRNLLCSEAGGEFVALADTSIELAHDWYQNIKQADFFDIIGSQLIVPDMKRCVDWGYEAEIGKKLFYLPLDYDEWSRKAFINGALILIRKRVFEFVHFNEELSSWEGDDLDFCMKASEIGFRVGVVQGATAIWRPDPKKEIFKKYISVEKSLGIVKAYEKSPEGRIGHIVQGFRSKLDGLLRRLSGRSLRTVKKL